MVVTGTTQTNKGRSPFNGRLSDFSSYIDSQISVHRKFKKIDQLIFRNAKEIYFNEKFPILYSMQNRNKLELKF